jgi:hypothetical protein
VNFNTHIIIPQATLDEGTAYYWRARYIGSVGAVWAWSPARSFTTVKGAIVHEKRKTPRAVISRWD